MVIGIGGFPFNRADYYMYEMTGPGNEKSLTYQHKTKDKRVFVSSDGKSSELIQSRKLSGFEPPVERLFKVEKDSSMIKLPSGKEVFAPAKRITKIDPMGYFSDEIFGGKINKEKIKELKAAIIEIKNGLYDKNTIFSIESQIEKLKWIKP